MNKLAPGIYADDIGRLHIVEIELLAFLGWPDDQAHRDQLGEIVRNVAGEHDIPVQEIQDGGAEYGPGGISKGTGGV